MGGADGSPPVASEWPSSIVHLPRRIVASDDPDNKTGSAAMRAKCTDTRFATMGGRFFEDLQVLRQAVFFWSVLAASIAHAELVRCVPDSPERHGGTGCSTLEDRRLSNLGKEALYWHIDEFASLADAQRHLGPASAAFEAHGRFWLATIGSREAPHTGGTHRADIGPLPVEAGRPLSMMIMSAYFEPQQITTVHVHSGPEAIYVVEGEQCMQLRDSATLTRAGDTAIAPAGEVMQLVATGSGPRRALVLVLHDAERPGTSLVAEPLPLKTCSAP